jgi:hypothetical protein
VDQDKAARIAKAEKARLKKKSKLPKWDQIEEHLPLDWDKEGDGYVSPEEEARCPCANVVLSEEHIPTLNVPLSIHLGNSRSTPPSCMMASSQPAVFVTIYTSTLW